MGENYAVRAGWSRVALFAAGVVVAGVALYTLSRFNYLLFHALLESFVALVGVGIFVVAWNTRDIGESPFLKVLGTGMLFAGMTELLHMLAYRGMGVFAVPDANLATQLWIATRLITAAAFLVAAVARPGRPSARVSFYAFGAAWLVVMVTIFVWPVFPVMYVEGVGLTATKIAGELAVMLALAVAGYLLWRRRSEYEPEVHRLLLGAIGLQIVSGVAFVAYADVYGVMNVLGHLALLGGFLLIYVSLIETTLSRPYALLFRELHRREQAEHRIADVLQTTLLSAPDRVPGVELGSAFRSATSGARVGGDFYDMWTPQPDHVAFVLGDVCGKGVEAAATTGMVRSILRGFTYENADPAEVLRRVNDVVYQELPDDRFVTVVYGLIDTATGELRVASAGHPDPILRLDGGRAAALQLPRNPPLGVVKDQVFEAGGRALEGGDTLVVFTDGLLDAGWEIGGFGEWRAVNTVSGSRFLQPGSLAERLLRAAVTYAGESLSDDVAVVVLRFEPVREETA